MPWCASRSRRPETEDSRCPSSVRSCWPPRASPCWLPRRGRPTITISWRRLQIDLNRIFRVDKSTGEVGACQFGLKEGSQVGVTLCYPPGQGAGPQPPSDYTLVASRHEHEAGAWRVDLRTGAMSICYVLDDSVVCTPPAK